MSAAQPDAAVAILPAAACRASVPRARGAPGVPSVSAGSLGTDGTSFPDDAQPFFGAAGQRQYTRGEVRTALLMRSEGYSNAEVGAALGRPKRSVELLYGKLRRRGYQVPEPRWPIERMQASTPRATPGRRPLKLDMERASTLRAQGASVTRIASILNCSVDALRRHLRGAGDALPTRSQPKQ